MIQPVDRFGHCSNSREIRYGWPFEHEYRYTQGAGRRDFAVGGGATAVLGHDSVDGIRSEHCLIGGFGKGASRENITGIRHVERRIDGVNTSYEIVMLRSAAERTQLLTSDGEKNASWVAAQCPHGSLSVSDLNPEISIHRLPGRAAQTEDGSAGLSNRQRRVGGNRPSVRVSSVDQKINVIGLQIRRETFSPPESADSYWSRLRCGRCRASRQRNRWGKRATRQCCGELASFGRSSQNQDVRLHGYRH